MAEQGEHMGNIPPTPPGADAILNEYFRERRADIPLAPHITKGSIKGLVLACRGSAPGVDGIPHELYHWGAFFAAALLAQRLWVAGNGKGDICMIIGPSVDSLMWIPKPDTTPGPNAMRPLQLPTCTRKLYGSMVMSPVGPHVEPMITDDQAAKKGGDCGRNIKRVYQRLEK